MGESDSRFDYGSSAFERCARRVYVGLDMRGTRWRQLHGRNALAGFSSREGWQGDCRDIVFRGSFRRASFACIP